MHTKVIEYVNNKPTALCQECNWMHQGSHQSILVAWWDHLQNIGIQLCIST